MGVNEPTYNVLVSLAYFLLFAKGQFLGSIGFFLGHTCLRAQFDGYVFVWYLFCLWGRGYFL
jgi:hypothetical protein